MTKQQFFGQYYGQKVFMMPDWECFNDNAPMPVNRVYFEGRHLESGYLSLKTLSSITDEHLVEVAKICDWVDDYPLQQIKEMLIDGRWLQLSLDQFIYLNNYLISQGYNLSKEAVANGWVKEMQS